MNKLQLKDITLIIIDSLNLERAQLALDICQKYCDFGDVKLLTHFENPNDKRIFKIEKVDSIKKYNEICIKKLNDYFNTDFCLIVQYDGFIINPQMWNDKFLEYDYIGAVDRFFDKNIIDIKDDNLVGNGGFSLRSKRLCKILKEEKEINIDYNNGEDYIISSIYRDKLKEFGIKFAQKDLANIFSTNAALNDKINIKNINSFGFHGTNIDTSHFFEKNPEFKELKKYYKNEVHYLKEIYSKILTPLDKLPFLRKVVRSVLLLLKKIYYKYFY